MVTVSKLSRLINGVQRQFDFAQVGNAFQSDEIHVGASSPAILTKTILQNLINLQNGSAVTYSAGVSGHNHFSDHFTESELGATSGTTGSDLIGDDNTYSNFVPTTTTVKGALSGIDAALSTGNGKVKITSADTSADYLNNSITAGAALSKSITNPGASEVLDLAVNVDDSTIEISSDALRVKDAGITNAKIATGIDAAKLADGSVSNAEFQYIGTLTSNAQDQLDAKVAKSGSSMNSAANITFSGGGEVLGLPSTPSAAGAAASKAYVDAVALGLAPKKAVRVATTAAGTLASSFENGDVIDGITLATGDRILIKDQATQSQNGIYVVNASGAPTRATDFDSISPIDEINGAWVPVQFGTVNAGRIYVQYGVVSTVGTDAITFEFYNPIAGLIGGDMVTVTGSTITLDLATSGGLESSNPGDAAGQLRIKLEASNPTLKFTGSNELAVKLNTGATTGNITTSATGLKVDTDGVTLETSSNALRIKNLGVDEAQLANNSVTSAKLASSVSGDGLTGGAGSPLAVGAGDGISVSANAVAVNVADLAGSGLENDGSNNLRISAAAAGNGLTGGAGSALSVTSAPGLAQFNGVAGESFAANTTYAVRFAISGESAGRLYKADTDATTTDKFHVVGLLSVGGSALSAADPCTVYMLGSTLTKETNDPAIAGTDIGKPIYLGTSGVLTLTAPTTANHACVIVAYAKSTTLLFASAFQVMGIN